VREFRMSPKEFENRGPDPRIRLLFGQGAVVLIGMAVMAYSALTPGLPYRKALFFASVAIQHGFTPK